MSFGQELHSQKVLMSGRWLLIKLLPKLFYCQQANNTPDGKLYSRSWRFARPLSVVTKTWMRTMRFSDIKGITKTHHKQTLRKLDFQLSRSPSAVINCYYSDVYFLLSVVLPRTVDRRLSTVCFYHTYIATSGNWLLMVWWSIYGGLWWLIMINAFGLHILTTIVVKISYRISDFHKNK